MQYQYILIFLGFTRRVLFCWDYQKKKGSEARRTLMEKKHLSFLWHLQIDGASK